MKLRPDSKRWMGRRFLCGAESVRGKCQTGLVTIGGILVQNSLTDRAIDRGKRRAQEIARRGRVLGVDGAAKVLHHRADARAVRAVQFVVNDRLRRALQYGFLALLYFCGRALSHSTLLRRLLRTINNTSGRSGFVKPARRAVEQGFVSPLRGSGKIPVPSMSTQGLRPGLICAAPLGLASCSFLRCCLRARRRAPKSTINFNTPATSMISPAL